MDAAKEILAGQFKPGYNYFTITLIGMLPAVALIGIAVYASNRIAPKRVYCVIAGGMIGYLAILILIHVAVIYPLYGGGKMSSTAVIAYLFIPYHSAWAITIGSLVGWMISCIPGIRRPLDPSRCPVCDDQFTGSAISSCTRCGWKKIQSRRRCPCGHIRPVGDITPCPRCGRFHCPKCQYNIEHVDHERCPECGEEIRRANPA